MSTTRAELSEAEMIRALVHFLTADGYHVTREVPNMGQSVDLVAICEKRRSITLIEAKRYNWKRALAQCKAHELVADFVCVAIANVTIPPSLQVEALRRNYGVIQYEPTKGMCIWIIQPKQNTAVWEPQRKCFIRNLEEISYGN